MNYGNTAQNTLLSTLYILSRCLIVLFERLAAVAPRRGHKPRHAEGCQHVVSIRIILSQYTLLDASNACPFTT